MGVLLFLCKWIQDTNRQTWECHADLGPDQHWDLVQLLNDLNIARSRDGVL